jgi:tetratricopeptide (TPR) repeat protein
LAKKDLIAGNLGIEMASLDDAIKILKSGKLREGMEVLERIVRDDPENVNVLYNLGMCYSELGNIDESIGTLEKCVELAPRHANALTALGFSYSRRGEQEKALAKLKAALEIEPDNFYALKNHGAVLAKLGRYNEAITSLGRANRLFPDSPEVLYGLALAYQEKGDTKTADGLFKRLIEADKDPKITELSMTARREIAMEALKSKGLRVDAVMYCLGALEHLSSKARNEIQLIVSEIAFLGKRGLDIHSSEKRYHLNSLEGDFTGLDLLCHMYVGFRILDQDIDIGADLSSEYQAALRLFSKQIDE